MASTRQQIKSTVSSSITFEYNRQNTAELLTAVLFEIIDNVFNLAEDEVTIQQVTNLASTLATKADLVNGKVKPEQLPAFSAFWGAMAKAVDNAQTVEEAIAAAVASLVNASPATLDTLNELAAALGNDANFSATITLALATKIPAAEKGVANGVATLDATGKIPAEQLPAAQAPATSFLALTDTPDSYAGMGGKFFKVKADLTGIEFTDAPSGGSTALGLVIMVPNAGAITVIIDTEAPIIVQDGANNNTVPATITIDAANSHLAKGRVITIVGNGSTTPTISGATKYPGDTANYKPGAGVLNKLWLTTDIAANSIKTVYYIWR